MILVAWIACAPTVYRMPGPLAGLGAEPWIEAEEDVAPIVPTTAGIRVANAAGKFVGRSALVVDGERYRWDCSGLVAAALAGGGIDVAGSGADLWTLAHEAGWTHRRRTPAIGDVAFFDNTYDRNGNGKLDDALSHVGIVESVEMDGTIVVVHLGSSGPARLRMNLHHPSTAKDDLGAVWNDPLRTATRREPTGTRHLAGELWVGFATFRVVDRSVADSR